MKLTAVMGRRRLPLTIERDETIVQALRREDPSGEMVIETVCGGKGSCGACRVKLLRKGKIFVKEVLACRTTGGQLEGMYVREPFDTVEIPEQTSAGNVEISERQSADSKGEIRLPVDLLPEEESDGGTAAEPGYGVAFDIGTTTIAAILWRLSPNDDGRWRPLATASARNPQAAFGADVMSRVEYAMSSVEGSREMQQLVLSCMNGLIEGVLSDARIEEASIRRLSAVGNPVMMHFLFGRDVTGLSKAPFRGETLPLQVEAAALGLKAAPGAELRTLPVMGGHLGADAAAVLLALRLPEVKDPAMVLDIGTNGELLITDGRGGLWGCSAAAGPAFEGGAISCGMRGEPGAIERVDASSDGRHLVTGVMGGGRPCGLCGSGLIDCAAALLQLGWMNEEGRLREEEGIALGGDVRLTQQDIRQLQTAKGAIRAGEEILMNAVHTRPKTIYLAGAFGNHLRGESARAIGLIPKSGDVVSCGNSAGVGASLILLSRREWERGCRWAKRLVHRELADDPQFAEDFLRGMYFPGAGGLQDP